MKEQFKFVDVWNWLGIFSSFLDIQTMSMSLSIESLRKNLLNSFVRKFALKLTPLKRIMTKLRRLKWSEAAKNVILIVSSLLIFDVLAAVLGAYYTSGNIWAFLGKSGIIILSDLLFLEGTVILAVGTFIAVAMAWHETKPSSEPTTEMTDNAEVTRDKQMRLDILMIIAGAILMGLSIIVGTLFL